MCDGAKVRNVGARLMSIIRDVLRKYPTVPEMAIRELELKLGVAGRKAMADAGVPVPSGALGSEGRQQTLVTIEAAKADIILWRNNVGAFEDPSGRWVRYGLANESKQMNAAIKSSDLIGIRKRFITADMVGSTIGQFVAREMKEEGWVFSPKDKHCGAQKVFNDLIVAYGGDARFCTGPGSF